MGKMRRLQLAGLSVLLLAVLCAGVWFFTRGEGPQAEGPDESASTADRTGAVDPTGQRYQFRLIKQSEETLWDGNRYNYDFYPYAGELLHYSEGGDAWLELSGLSGSETVLRYDFDEIGFSADDQAQTLAGLYLDGSGTMWSLIASGAGEYSVGEVGPHQNPEARQTLKRYPLQYAPEQFAVWENTAVIAGERKMAVCDLVSGEMTQVDDVTGFCLDGEGILYYCADGDGTLVKYSLPERAVMWERNIRAEEGVSPHQVFFHPTLGLFSIARPSGRVDCRDTQTGEALYTLFSMAEDTDLDYSEDRFYHSSFAVDSGYRVWFSLIETDVDTIPHMHTRYTWGFEPFLPEIDPDEAVTLIITAPYKVDAVASSARMYQRKHPEVEVIWDTQYISREEFQAHSAQYAEQLALRLMTGDVGDILMLHGSGLDVDAILKTDVMADLSARLDTCSFREDLESCVIEALCGDDGAIRGLPVAIRPQYLIYNETLAEELGLTWDPEDLTWSQLLTLAETWQSEGKDLSLFWPSADDMAGHMLYGMLLANLDSLTGADGGARMDQPWLRDMLEQLRDLQGSTQLSAATGAFWWSPGSLTKTLFVQESGAYYGDRLENLRAAEEASGVTLRLVPIPRGEETAARQSYAFCWGIPSASQKQDAAWDFLQFLVSRDGLVSDTYFAETCLLNRAADRERFEQDARRHALYVDGVMQPQNEERHYTQFRAVLDHPISRLSEPFRWYDAIYVPITQYLEGTASLEEALAQAQEKWERVLAE